MIIKNIKEIILEHISDNSVKYFFLMLCFFTGIAAGAVFVTALPVDKATAITGAIDGFCSEIQKNGADWLVTFKNSFLGNLKTFLFLYVCGFWPVLIPLVYGQMIAKGFVVGFTIGFMSLFYSGGGVLFILVSVIPQSIILIPVICVMSVISVNYALIRRQTRKNMLLRKEVTRDLVRYTYLSSAVFVMMLVSTLVDTFVIPVFVRMVSGII